MSSDGFFRDLPSFTSFARIADPAAYAPLPNDWVIGFADVVSSTQAIDEGRYKAVNLAGASAISAISNRLGTLDFPYVFAGDGMAYAVGPGAAADASAALAATVSWVGRQLDLSLRGGIIAVSEVRAAGRDIRVARFSPSPSVSYAMFAGGGLAWAETELKEGRLQAPVGSPADVPDLNGLSCRFKPIRARNGLILSLIVAPLPSSQESDFRQLVADLLTEIENSGEIARPISAERLPLAWPPQGYRMETRLQRRIGESVLFARTKVAIKTLFEAAVMMIGKNIGHFSPDRYRQETADNSDFRKYEDGLMMTIDCSSGLVQRLRARLLAARQAGIAEFGMHEQSTALITCVVPSPVRPDHVHFVDGAAGGYALAARDMKLSRASTGGIVGRRSSASLHSATGTTLSAVTS